MKKSAKNAYSSFLWAAFQFLKGKHKLAWTLRFDRAYHYNYR